MSQKSSSNKICIQKTSTQKLARFMKLNQGQVVLEGSRVFENYISILFSSLNRRSGANNPKTCDRCYSLIPRSRKGQKAHSSQTKLVNEVQTIPDLIRWSSSFALKFGEQGKTLIRIPLWNPEQCNIDEEHLTLQQLLGPIVEEEEGKLGWAHKSVQTSKIEKFNMECENVTRCAEIEPKTTVNFNFGLRSPPISIKSRISVAASVGRRQRTYSHSFSKQYKRMIETVNNK